MCPCDYVWAHGTWCMWSIGGQHWGVSCLFLLCGPEDWTQDVRVGSKHLYQLSHLTGTKVIYTLFLQIFFYSFYFVINFIIEYYNKNHTPKLTWHKSHVNKLLTVASILNHLKSCVEFYTFSIKYIFTHLCSTRK